MKKMKLILCLLGGLILPTITGCRPPVPPVSHAYFGETGSMVKVVSDINRNNGKIPTIWAQLDYRATLIDKIHGETVVSGDGGLLYARPNSLRLVGNKDIAGKVFELGSNDKEYWVSVAGSTDTTWWGNYDNLGKPGSKELPIRPDLILEVLGVSLFDTNFFNQPAPVMRFNNEADAYMFTWQMRAADRWVAVKEVWYDRVTKLPELVLLFDDNGRVILRAKLTAPISVESADVPENQWPKIAKQYSLFFPESKSQLAFELRNVKLSQKGSPSGRSFVRPLEPETKTVIQVDKDVQN